MYVNAWQPAGGNIMGAVVYLGDGASPEDMGQYVCI